MTEVNIKLWIPDQTGVSQYNTIKDLIEKLETSKLTEFIVDFTIGTV